MQRHSPILRAAADHARTARGSGASFIGLERTGGVMVYDITSPASPSFVTYVNPRMGDAGDLGPEGLAFVPAEDRE